MSSCIFLKYSVLHVVYTNILDEICGDEVTIHISLFSLHFRGIITLDQASSLTTTIFDQAKTTLKPKSQQVFEDRRRQLKVIVDTTIQELQTLTIRYAPHPPTSEIYIVHLLCLFDIKWKCLIGIKYCSLCYSYSTDTCMWCEICSSLNLIYKLSGFSVV